MLHQPNPVACSHRPLWSGLTVSDVTILYRKWVFPIWGSSDNATREQPMRHLHTSVRFIQVVKFLGAGAMA